MGDRAAYIGPIGVRRSPSSCTNMSGYAISCALAETFTMGVKAGMDPVALWEAVRQGRRRPTPSPSTDLLDQFLTGKYDPPNIRAQARRQGLQARDRTRTRARPADAHLPTIAYAEMLEACNRGWEGRDYARRDAARAGAGRRQDSGRSGAREAGGRTREVKLFAAATLLCAQPTSLPNP